MFERASLILSQSALSPPALSGLNFSRPRLSDSKYYTKL